MHIPVSSMKEEPCEDKTIVTLYIFFKIQTETFNQLFFFKWHDG